MSSTLYLSRMPILAASTAVLSAVCPPIVGSIASGRSRNYTGVDIANNVVASVDSAGEICLWSSIGTEVIVDVTGWFDDSGSASPPESVSPERIVDSRFGVGAPQQKLGPANPLVIDVVGLSATRPDGTTARWERQRHDRTRRP